MRHSQPATASLGTLTGRVAGPVFSPGDDGYDAERAGFTLNNQQRPHVIVGAANAADVKAAVEFAKAHGLPVTAHATGHCTVPADGGVLINTSRMTGIRMNQESNSVWIDAGVRWERVIEEAARHGLAPLSGSSPHVGAVSYTLGGGLGLLARRYGYAVDHVRTIDVVTADAQLRRVTAEADPDLFWALRGGRSNFGIVTGLEIGLLPVPRIYGGGLYFDTDLVDDVPETWRRWTATVPDEMTSAIALIPFPDVPGVPEPLRGRYIAHIRIAYTGDPATGEQLLAPLRAAGPRVIDDVRDMPYTESGSISNDPTEPQAGLGENTMLSELDAATLQAVLDHAGPQAPVPCIVELRHLGGALAQRPAVASAVGHRDAQYVVSIISPLIGDAGPIREVHEHVLDALAPWAVGPFLNFMFGDTATPERVRAAYEPADYERLAALKAVYDPTNMFRHNHNIPPAS